MLNQLLYLEEITNHELDGNLLIGNTIELKSNKLFSLICRGGYAVSIVCFDSFEDLAPYSFDSQSFDLGL